MTFQEILSKIKKECEDNNIIFHQDPNPVIQIQSLVSNGAFVTKFIDNNEIKDQPALMIATNDNTLETLIHEYCHMQQYLERPEVFDYLDELSYIWSWVDGGYNHLTIKEINEAFVAFYALEVDCERRAVEIHKKWNTGIDIDSYIQKANAYTLFYMYVREHRQWYKPGSEPYNIEIVWTSMPKTFDFDLLECYHSVRNLFKHCI